MVLNRKVAEADPNLSVFNSDKFFDYVFFGVASVFNDLPEAEEFVEFYLTVTIHVYGLKELSS